MVDIVDCVSRALAVIGMVLLVFSMLLITVSVCGRYFFLAPIPDDIVVLQALLVILVFLPFAFVQQHKSHLTVTVLTDALPRRGRFLCRQFALIMGMVFIGIVALASFGDAKTAFMDGAYFEGKLEVREWPARLSVFIGTGWLFLKMLTDFFQGILLGPEIVEDQATTGEEDA